MTEISEELNSPLKDIDVSFKHDIIKEALKTKFVNSKNKITDEAIELISELAKILTTEASVRAIKQAKMEYRTKVTVEHVEVILPQLMEIKLGATFKEIEEAIKRYKEMFYFELVQIHSKTIESARKK